MRNIVLIGMPATGKSTVGVILAKRLGYDFLDTDIAICKTTGRTLPVLLEQEGVDGFVRIEGQVASGLTCAGTVIATGGSMVLSSGAMEHLKENGVVVWLDTPLEVLQARLPEHLSDRGVVAPNRMTVRELFVQRRPLYERYADMTIACNGDMEHVLNRLERGVAPFLDAAVLSRSR
ncbi:shikimate kinase [Ruminococcus champanellensis]